MRETQNQLSRDKLSCLTSSERKICAMSQLATHLCHRLRVSVYRGPCQCNDKVKIHKKTGSCFGRWNNDHFTMENVTIFRMEMDNHGYWFGRPDQNTKTHHPKCKRGFVIITHIVASSCNTVSHGKCLFNDIAHTHTETDSIIQLHLGHFGC